MQALSSFSFSESQSHSRLQSFVERIEQTHLREMFASDADRFKRFSRVWEGLLFDFSKNRIDQEVFDALIELAEESGLQNAIEAMFAGEHINVTEDRAVLHVALRSSASFSVDGEEVTSKIQSVKSKMASFVNAIHSGEYKGSTGKDFTDVVNIGIGGSDLGPLMVSEALSKPGVGLTAHFVSNVDGADLYGVLDTIDPETTLFVVVSKTFTTQETLANAEEAKQWLINALGDKASVADHFVAVSTNIPGVAQFGIQEDRVFGFWNWVGGRYSLWGAVGLSIALSCGWNEFEDLLAGAEKADLHFRNTRFEDNIPVLMGLLGVWNRNCLQYASHAIIPYSQQLHRFPAYLQQADMESNGKYVGRDGDKVDHQTGPVIWGEPGTNGQHAFFQLLHQGTDIVPVDFIGYKEPTSPSVGHHQKLMANFLAQQEALMNGKTKDEVMDEMKEDPKGIADFRVFEGNRPSSCLLFEKLDAESLGQLIALYEHKIFVQGILWNVYSFDQWGVELGKQLAKRILPAIEGEARPSLDGSTNGQLDFLLKQ